MKLFDIVALTLSIPIIFIIIREFYLRYKFGKILSASERCLPIQLEVIETALDSSKDPDFIELCKNVIKYPKRIHFDFGLVICSYITGTKRDSENNLIEVNTDVPWNIFFATEFISNTANMLKKY